MKYLSPILLLFFAALSAHAQDKKNIEPWESPVCPIMSFDINTPKSDGCYLQFRPNIGPPLPQLGPKNPFVQKRDSERYKDINYVSVMKKYADSGIAESQYDYAIELLSGDATKRNEELALKYTKSAAQQNFAPAKTLLLEFQYFGWANQNPDPKGALSSLQALSQKGNQTAKETVARLTKKSTSSQKKDGKQRASGAQEIPINFTKVGVYLPQNEKYASMALMVCNGMDDKLIDLQAAKALINQAKDLSSQLDKDILLINQGKDDADEKFEIYELEVRRINFYRKKFEETYVGFCGPKNLIFDALNTNYSLYSRLSDLNKLVFP